MWEYHFVSAKYGYQDAIFRQIKVNHAPVLCRGIFSNLHFHYRRGSLFEAEKCHYVFERNFFFNNCRNYLGSANGSIYPPEFLEQFFILPAADSGYCAWYLKLP